MAPTSSGEIASTKELGEKISVTIIATGFEQRPNKVVNKGATGADRIVVSLDDDPDRQGFLQKKTKLSDIGFEESSPTEQPTTFEFDNVRSSIYQRSRYNYDEPAPRNDVRDQQQRIEEERRLQERENMRRERLRSNVVKLSNPQTINDLESEPAYMRRGVNLDDVPNSAEPALSKWTISDDDDPELREGNSFLHDNVD